MLLSEIVAAAFAYLLGSISFAVVVSKVMRLPDPLMVQGTQEQPMFCELVIKKRPS
jgi:hypothetical protein